MTAERRAELWAPILRQSGLAAACAVGLVCLLSLLLRILNIPPIPAMQAIWEGAIGSREAGYQAPIALTLTKMSPLLLTGLGMTVAWRAGMFSIGGEGQLLMGAVAAMALWSVAGQMPPALLILLMLCASAAGGAVWSCIAGWLRVRRNVPEVISTIMLNYIALNIVGWLVTEPGPLHGKTQSGPHTDPLPSAIALPNLVPPATSGAQVHLHVGIVLAFIAAPCIYLYLFRTPAGFGLRLVGQNPEAARAARYPIDRLRMQAMLVSGALCGLTGVIELLGVTGRLGRDFSAGWGYTAIPVALLGGLSPFGALLSALFFGALSAGCNNAQRSVGVPSNVAYIIQAAVVLTVIGASAWRSRKSGRAPD